MKAKSLTIDFVDKLQDLIYDLEGIDVLIVDNAEINVIREKLENNAGLIDSMLDLIKEY